MFDEAYRSPWDLLRSMVRRITGSDGRGAGCAGTASSLRGSRKGMQDGIMRYFLEKILMRNWLKQDGPVHEKLLQRLLRDFALNIRDILNVKCCRPIFRMGSKRNPSSQGLGAEKSIESGFGSREIHRVKVWEQRNPSSQGLAAGKSIESEFGSKGYPSSQSLATGIAVESRFGSKGYPSSQACAAGIARLILG